VAIESDPADRRFAGLAAAPDAIEAGTVAVALRYDPGSDATPKVVASGRGAVADRIIAAAAAAQIPLHADADLAALLAVLDLEAEIPVEAFAVVAEILICLYRANAAARQPEGGQ
jgi:flagellar biosynthesis protein